MDFHGKRQRRLRVVDHGAQPRAVEPLANCVQQALDALGWNAARASKETGISSQHMSQILKRKQPYGSRPPTIETLQKLEKIPGLSQLDILRAVGESTGIGRPAGESPYLVEWSPTRRAVHNIVDKLPEDQLARVAQILMAMFD